MSFRFPDRSSAHGWKASTTTRITFSGSCRGLLGLWQWRSPPSPSSAWPSSPWQSRVGRAVRKLRPQARREEKAMPTHRSRRATTHPTPSTWLNFLNKGSAGLLLRAGLGSGSPHRIGNRHAQFALPVPCQHVRTDRSLLSFVHRRQIASTTSRCTANTLAKTDPTPTG
jgi:hypothetical protein